MGYQPPLTQDVTSVEGASATTLVATSNVESIISANTTVAGALQKANNLSDVTTKGTGRFNIRVPILAGVQAAATANVNIASAPASVDGFSFISSGLDSVLLTAQSTPSQNGPWIWNGAGSALTRTTDWPAAGAVTTGRIVQVQNGTVNANTLWMIDVPSTGITIDTTAQTWVSLNILGNTVNEATIRANTLNQMGAPTGALNLNSQRIINLAPPQADTDAAQALLSSLAYTVFQPASNKNFTTTSTSGVAVESAAAGLLVSSGTLSTSSFTLTAQSSTASYVAVGTITVVHAGVTYFVQYTGISGSTFTGCTCATAGGGVTLTSGDAIAPANLTIQVTAISSTVLVELEASTGFAAGAAADFIYWELLNHATTTQVAGSNWVFAYEAPVATAADDSGRVRAIIPVTGLSAGTTYIWDWGWAVTAGTGAILTKGVNAGSPTTTSWGSAFMLASAG